MCYPNSYALDKRVGLGVKICYIFESLIENNMTVNVLLLLNY